MFFNYIIKEDTQIADILGINAEILSLEIEVEYNVTKAFAGTLFDPPEPEEVNIEFIQVLSIKYRQEGTHIQSIISITDWESSAILGELNFKDIKNKCLEDYKHQEDENIKEQASRLIENNY
jgi:hypothetical protein